MLQWKSSIVQLSTLRRQSPECTGQYKVRPRQADLQTKGTDSPIDIDAKRANMQPQMCVCSISQSARPIIICCNNARYAGMQFDSLGALRMATSSQGAVLCKIAVP